ncbi:class I SAM-dependent methyltransferase [Mumia sp. DW29H23]|uniref:class I SAM-dependent methyltransferase n=1 Tax=Mumia sp. DW29H23 TaxID=3421241 RepID=UPI003D69E497
MAVPGRVSTAVAALPLRTSSDVLEIGGGPGVAAQLVLERLGPHGSYLGVDRSAVAEERTRDRCAAAAADARWEVVRGPVEEVAPTLPEASRDIAFAVNVNLFWTGDATPVAAALRRVLRPGGSLWLFYETPSGAVSDSAAEAVVSSLRGGGFEAVTVATPAPTVVAFGAPQTRNGITKR